MSVRSTSGVVDPFYRTLYGEGAGSGQFGTLHREITMRKKAFVPVLGPFIESLATAEGLGLGGYYAWATGGGLPDYSEDGIGEPSATEEGAIENLEKKLNRIGRTCK